jgi:hypothetical protein
MTTSKPIEEQIADYLKDKGSGTVDEIAAAVKISRTSSRKYLAGLNADGTLDREPGGRAGRRKLPDIYSLSQKEPGSKKAASAGSKSGRLSPGELDKHVLAYMRKHEDELPQTASAIGKAIERSSGAVANCLVRLEKQEKVRLATPKPRAYELRRAR